MRPLPRPFLAFILAVTLGGIATLAGLMIRSRGQDRPAHLILAGFVLLVVALAELRPVPVTRKTTISVYPAAVFAAILLLGPALSAWTASLGMALACWRLGRRWYNIAFNFGTYAMAAGAAGVVYEAMQPQSFLMSWHSVWALTLTGTTHLVINSGLVASVVALREHQSLWQTWVAMLESVGPEYFTLLLLGILAVVVYQYQPLALGLIVLPVLVVHYSLVRSQELEAQTVEGIQALADTIDNRDPYTFEHSQRVAAYTEIIAKQLGLPLDQVERIKLSARVHDVGKMGVSNTMLHKPGSLTDEEWSVMQKHVVIGAEIVGRFKHYREGRDNVLYHHERYDGSGYPEGRRGDAIPIGARIIAVADAFDAMTSDRPYRQALRLEVALRELQRHAGTQFDPLIVGAFLKAWSKEPEHLTALVTQRASVSTLSVLPKIAG